jgi:hypothetical protein
VLGRWWLVAGAVVAAGAALLRLDVGPVPLTRQQFHLPARREDVYRRMTAFEPPVNVVERTDTYAVAEFPVEAGWYRTVTRERVALDPAVRRGVFEQLRSPFPTVRIATETFELEDAPAGGTTVTLTGEIEPRLGVAGWLLTRWLVRPRWDRIDAAFLARVRRELGAAAR